jgi:uncharacterized membrane protein YgcG
MSSKNKFSESPNHFIVLDAIARDMKKIDSIAEVTKLNKDEVELIINDLELQRLITVEVKKWLFVFKKIEAFITETGARILNSKKEELSYKSQKLQQLYETGNRAQMQNYMNDNRSWIPMMLFSGLINMVMFASMMSFMGMAMNPAESAQTEDQVGDSGAGETGAGGEASGAENTGVTSDTGDTGGGFSDTGFDGGGGGMDTGGFDSF